MKNVLVIDGAENCAYSVFQATEAEFRLIFPEDGQDIEYSEDLFDRIGDISAGDPLTKMWERPILKKDANGIHGMLFYRMTYRKKYYGSKREKDIDPSCITEVEQRLYDKS